MAADGMIGPGGAGSVEITAAAGAAAAPTLRLDETGWVVTQHKNKYGQDYPAAAYVR